MSPRPYQLGKRQGRIDEGRQRILDTAQTLLSESTSYADFTIDAIARRADVARATVYYQFDSKTGLLEALCDSLADAGRLSELASAFSREDPVEAVVEFIGCFARFWDADRLAMRRLRALASLDPDVRLVISSRDDRRRSGLTVLVRRLDERGLLTGDANESVSTLFALTSFEFFDDLAAPDRTLAETTPHVVALARTLWHNA
jgi:AcrR family transcriptional regulator